MPGLQPRNASYLEIRNLSHRYEKKLALQSVSLNAAKSEILALLGPSGSGKSTLLAAMAGIVKPEDGEILVSGRNLLDLPPEARGLGMVFQDYALWPHMTVAQNIAFPLRARGYRSPEIKIQVENALRRVGLEGFQGRRPHELSGGQQQRVALARAIVAEVQLLLLDEPLSALDPATRATIRAELAEILRRLNLTTVIVTHDREEAFELADRVAVLVEGQIQQHAAPEEIYERPANVTVARFMGVNVLSVQAVGESRAQLSGGNGQLDVPAHAGDELSLIAIVPERTAIVDDPAGMENVVAAHLLKTQYRGGDYRLQVRVGGTHDGQIIEARSKTAPVGESLYVHLPVEAIHIIPPSRKLAVPLELSEPAAPEVLTALKEESA
jgi:ABC-type Fe3+/spermidine/putrescine transport system ATPase subunit